ncbi:hypothetical protein [Flavilitoribacter nigricans]|uniref:Uncharacterized protein n=1 Tax=Flavilitoribacter nigricans (strain ATCC 23147 / DSM 23189 / NBRC 102662 / NCIMB 1420 / SS-2) TaxID=1122177 RepID=A0A2D0MWX9_FLAN2|nr:hypothetical protein [Flavilitoribacter nigricans]PHN00764.1 hypothetical protein CRP01_40605 [Flavilitoribacter nigricans DSM 23189 = NBRC 102662]
MPNITIGSSDYDGILMYVVHEGGPSANQVISDANTVWFEENGDVRASMYGVAETDVTQDPEAEILSQTNISRLPTLLFVRVINGQMTAILSRKEGTVPQSRIRTEFRRLLKQEPVYEPGDGGGTDDLIEMNGRGGFFGLGMGDGLGGCPKWMPGWICDFPLWIFIVLLAAAAVLLTLKFKK